MEQLLTKSYTSSIQDIDDKGIVKVAANAFGNEDAHKDISVYGSYTKTIQERFHRLKWYKNHNQNELLGVPKEASQTNEHLVVVGKLNLNKQISKDIYEDYKIYAAEGKSLEHSVGVIAVKRDQQDKRKVLEWKWFEYSTLTNWGANPNTPMLSIKSEDNPLDAIEFLELCLRKGNYSDERGHMMEEHIAILKALLTTAEPPDGTQSVIEPLFDIKAAINNLKFKLD